jgi:FdhE protein
MTSAESDGAEAGARLGRLKEQRPELGELFDYYGGLLAAAREETRGFRADIAGLSPEVSAERAGAGRPLLEPAEVKIDWELFDRLLRRMIELSARHRELLGEDVGLPEWFGTNGRGEALLKGFMRDRSALDEIAGAAGGSSEFFSFLAQQALVPFMRNYARALGGRVTAESWACGRCPVCGAEPLMARLEEETGKRHLQCGLCGTEWAFKRMACPFCGSEEQDKLRFFCEENDEGYRVDVCDGCKGYIKTADARKLAREICLPIEDLATVHLDLVAQEEGFHREGGGFPAGD